MPEISELKLPVVFKITRDVSELILMMGAYDVFQVTLHCGRPSLMVVKKEMNYGAFEVMFGADLDSELHIPNYYFHNSEISDAWHSGKLELDEHSTEEFRLRQQLEEL